MSTQVIPVFANGIANVTRRNGGDGADDRWPQRQVSEMRRDAGDAQDVTRLHLPPALRQHGHVKGPYDTGRFAEVGDFSQVNSSIELAEVVQRMLSDLLAHPDQWENPTLDRFLEALAASLQGLPGLYANRHEQFPKTPTWKIFAEALVMATGYE